MHTADTHSGTNLQRIRTDLVSLSAGKAPGAALHAEGPALCPCAACWTPLAFVYLLQ